MDSPGGGSGLGAGGGDPDPETPRETQRRATGDVAAVPPSGRPAGDRVLRVLYLFAGVPREGDMSSWLAALAGQDRVEIKNVDIQRNKADDLTKPRLRDELLAPSMMRPSGWKCQQSLRLQ